ncbi:hypothetical protein Tco_1561339 [Tanacetum coccineum]
MESDRLTTNTMRASSSHCNKTTMEKEGIGCSQRKSRKREQEHIVYSERRGLLTWIILFLRNASDMRSFPRTFCRAKSKGRIADRVEMLRPTGSGSNTPRVCALTEDEIWPLLRGGSCEGTITLGVWTWFLPGQGTVIPPISKHALHRYR